MDTDLDSRSSIVIIEAGAGWPSWITDYQRIAPNAAVVAQSANEDPEAFRTRVLHRVDELARRPGKLSVGVVLCVENATAEQHVTREIVSRALASALSSTGDLVLAAIEGRESFKHELFALAGELCENDSGKRVNVRVRFATSESGTMPSVLPAVPAHYRRDQKATGTT